MNTQALKQPLNHAHIKTRNQAGMNLSYIEGYYAIERANELFGFGGWSKNVSELKLIQEEAAEIKGKMRYDVAYIATVLVEVNTDSLNEDGIVLRNRGGIFEDVGYGNGTSYRSKADAHELAAKEAVTDAMKRCLRHFGDQFGNGLYNKDNTPSADAQEPTEQIEKTAEKPVKTNGLPNMTVDQKKRMARIWKFVNENLNKDGIVKATDIATAVYTMLGRWPDTAADEEHVVNNIKIERN